MNERCDKFDGYDSWPLVAASIDPAKKLELPIERSSSPRGLSR